MPRPVRNHRYSRPLDLQAAADLVALPPATVEALASAGYLAVAGRSGRSPTFDLADLKAFVARNADNGSGEEIPRPLSPILGAEELVDLLERRAGHMALRLFKMYTTVFPRAAA